MNASSAAANVVLVHGGFVASRVRLAGVDALGGQVTDPAWRAKPSWYLVTAEDRMIPSAAQRTMSRRAGSTAAAVAAAAARVHGQAPRPRRSVSPPRSGRRRPAGLGDHAGPPGSSVPIACRALCSHVPALLSSPRMIARAPRRSADRSCQQEHGARAGPRPSTSPESTDHHHERAHFTETEGRSGISELRNPGTVAYHREFSLTEGAARGTRGRLGPRGRDQRGLVAGTRCSNLSSGRDPGEDDGL